MKTIGTYLTVLYWLALAGQVFGKDNRTKLRNDPTYSPNNYKHANKAAAARTWEANSGIAVQSPTALADQTGLTNTANYKRQLPGQAPVGGVTVGHTPSTNVADRNYKIQRPGQSTGPVGSTVAGKKRNRPDSSAATGD